MYWVSEGKKMDVNVETSVVNEEQEDKKKEDLKGIIWTIIGVLLFTVLIALVFKYIEFRLGIMK